MPQQANSQIFRISLCIFILLIIPLLIFVLNTPATFILWLNENLLQDFTFDQHQNSTPKNDVPPKSRISDHPLLLLISYDGFRYDYIEKYPDQTPTFRWLISNGVYAPQGLKNTFITITAPNHYGIVTGLYEENHGVIANSFFDPVLNESFAYFDTRWKTNPAFFGGDPIWNLNDRSEPGSRATGCVMWVGCDVPINNQTPPLHHVSWEGSLDWTVRVDSLIGWFTNPEKPINFGLLYIEEPDETGHNFGPDAPEMAQMLRKLDQLTAYLLWRLHTAGLLEKINLIFTADHGMASVPLLNVVNLDNFVNSSLYTVYGGTPNWNVLPKPGHEQEVYNKLKHKVPHLQVYNKSEIPVDYHYKENRRIMPLQLVSDLHWWLAHNFTLSKSGDNNGEFTLEREIRGKTRKFVVNSRNATTGEHGYNNSEPQMHPYFVGYGPGFKQGFNATWQPMNLDLYPLMCYLLGLKPAPNNGSFERVRALLRDQGALWGMPFLENRQEISVEWQKSAKENGNLLEIQWFMTYHSCTSLKLDFLLMLLLIICLALYLSYLFNMADKKPAGQQKKKCDAKKGNF